MTTTKRWVACPTCKTLVPHGEEDFPFCSERCKMIDLGRWASDSYRIPDPDCHD